MGHIPKRLISSAISISTLLVLKFRDFAGETVFRGVLFLEDTKWSLPVIIKPEGNLCLSIHIVAITRQCYLNFHMGIKFRDDLFSRISLFAIFLQSRKTRN